MPFRSRWQRVAFIIACLTLAAVYAVFLMAPAVGTFHDDGIYLVTARALAEDRGYRIISVPGEPAQTKYPILFPWLVSVIWRLFPSFPDNLLALRLVPLTAAAAWFWLSARLLRRLGASPQATALIVLLTAASPWVVFLSTMTLSETLFAALMTAAILVVSRVDAGGRQPFDGLVAGLLMGAAILTRSAGVAPAGAGLVALLMKRQWRPSALYAAGVTVMAAPWYWWVSQQNTQAGVDSFYSSTNYASWNIVFNYGWQDKLTVLTTNLLFTLMGLGEFFGLDIRNSWQLVIVFLFVVLMLRGMWIGRSTPIALIVVCSLAMMQVWAWPPGRFMVPLLPLFLWLVVVGAAQHLRVLGFFAIVLLMMAGIELRALTHEARTYGVTWFVAGAPPDWHAVKRQIEWIDSETPGDAVVAAVHDPSYFLFTGRRALRPDTLDPLRSFYGLRVASDDGADLRRRLLAINADYLVVIPNDGIARRIDAMLRESPGSLTRVAGDESSGYLIYRVNRERLARSVAVDRPSQHGYRCIRAVRRTVYRLARASSASGRLIPVT